MLYFANVIKNWKPCDDLVEESRRVLAQMVNIDNVWKIVKSIGNNPFFVDTCYKVCYYFIISKFNNNYCNTHSFFCLSQFLGENPDASLEQLIISDIPLTCWFLPAFFHLGRLQTLHSKQILASALDRLSSR